MIRTLAIALVASLLAPLAALAMGWVTDSSSSTIKFRYTIDGKARQGFFREFQATGSFVPDQPDLARMEFVVATGSIDLSNSVATAYATSAEWFDSRNYPNAQFDLTRLIALGGTRYRAEGQLAIRGQTKPTAFDLDLILKDGIVRANGTLKVLRNDFQLGYGLSTALVDVGPDVLIELDLQARAN